MNWCQWISNVAMKENLWFSLPFLFDILNEITLPEQEYAEPVFTKTIYKDW